MAIRNRNYRSGFTLIEVLMVVVILAVLAAVIIPRFTGYADKGSQSSTKTNLQTLRSAVQAYYVTNSNTWPASTLASLLTTQGGTLRVIPKESVSNSAKVVNSLDGTGGWFYDTTNHDVFVNLNGNDTSGTPYNTY
ncbi:MAG: prepilin-type N-terminal cleavage/methylation domain-containing protein [Candidatus Wallbacteria bacterium]|nr:prepilin-type N-terminal cleavage/methylation domain-containing protein [Candidatus Wallbacteria bacterium]